MIVDASVVLSAFFPDENQPQAHALIRGHVTGLVELAAPTLLSYEVISAVGQAQRRGRVSEEQAGDVLRSFEGLGIDLRPVSWQHIVPLALRFDRSGYDAAYMALAEILERPLITADRRLYNAVREQVEWVRWIGDYSTA